jgi:PKHD-type hydroxylase
VVLTLPDVLSCDDTERLCSALDKGDTADHDRSQIVLDGLQNHPLMSLGVQPRVFSAPAFQLHREGMESATRSHDAIVDGMRTDLGVTVFLSNQSAYEGGELLIDTGFGLERYKEPAGTCVIRPGSASYGIARVTRGARWTAELWAQSSVRDPAQREILYDIGSSLQLLRLFEGDAVEEVDRLQRCQQTLLRMWSEP